MLAQNIVLILFFISFGVCVHSGVVIEGNTTKSEAQKSYSCYCTKSNQVCIDGWCYCAPNYKKDLYGNCVYKGCTWDSDCMVTQDWNRHCYGGSCVCDSTYTEDWNNGRKCTYTYHVNAWAWAWIFFVIPGVVILIFFLRRRRLMLHSHVSHCPPPVMHCPPQQVHTVHQPQVVTVYHH